MKAHEAFEGDLRRPSTKRYRHDARTILAVLKAKIKFQIKLPSGFGPESAQNLRFPQGNDGPDPPQGAPGGGGAKKQIKNHV